MLDLDGGDEADFQEEGWDKENSATNVPKSVPKLKKEETRKKQAIKSYIAGLSPTDNDVVGFVRMF